MKPYNIFFKNYFINICQLTESIDSVELEKIASLAIDLCRCSKKIIVIGNGGSAAIASHVSVDFTKVTGIRAINFNEAGLITCFANDYGYERWVVEALKAYADPEDLVILISSSGRSPNIVNGAIKAKEMGLKVVTLSGFDEQNPLRKLGDINLWADSTAYNIVEMTHHIWLLAIVDYIVEATRKNVK